MLKTTNSNLCALGAYESPRCKCVELHPKQRMMVIAASEYNQVGQKDWPQGDKGMTYETDDWGW